MKGFFAALAGFFGGLIVLTVVFQLISGVFALIAGLEETEDANPHVAAWLFLTAVACCLVYSRDSSASMIHVLQIAGQFLGIAVLIGLCYALLSLAFKKGTSTSN